MPEAAPHVLILVENLPVPFDRRVWQEAQTLRDAGYRVSVICPKGKGQTAAHEVIDDIAIWRHALPQAKSARGYLLEYPVALLAQFWLSLRVRLQRGRIDAIQACSPPDLMFLVALPHRLFGTRFVFDHHDLSPELFVSKFGPDLSGPKRLVLRALEAFERMTFRLATVSVATNETFRAIAIDRGGMDPDRVFVVKSYPAPGRFVRRDPPAALKAPGQHLIGYLGIMGAQDGVDMLVAAMAEIQGRHGRHDIGCLVIGDGPELPALREQAGRLGLGEAVRFTGYPVGRRAHRASVGARRGRDPRPAQCVQRQALDEQGLRIHDDGSALRAVRPHPGALGGRRRRGDRVRAFRRGAGAGDRGPGRRCPAPRRHEPAGLRDRRRAISAGRPRPPAISTPSPRHSPRRPQAGRWRAKPPMAELPQISVVIPHLNQPDLLGRCLGALAGQQAAPAFEVPAFEVIVVDNGSSTPPAAVCAGFGARLLAESTPGPGPARSRGAAAAQGEILAFIDADCRAEPDWLAAIARRFADPQVEIIGGDVRIAPEDPRHLTATEAYESIYGYRMKLYIERDRYAATCNMAVRREIFERVGPFAGISVAEDMDWGRRATALGYRHRYAPEMRIATPARGSFGELARKWNRHIAHDFAMRPAGLAPRLAWVVRALALGASPLAEIGRIAGSDRLGGEPRADAGLRGGGAGAPAPGAGDAGAGARRRSRELPAGLAAVLSRCRQPAAYCRSPTSTAACKLVTVKHVIQSSVKVG